MRALYLTHPQVMIDPAIAVPHWGLSPEGRARAEAFAARGVVPAQLKLIYLADRLSLQYAPSEAELRGFGNAVGALWQAIASALETGNFPARRGRMCRWCTHQAHCPEFGGTPPPYPGAPATTPSR